MRSPVITLAACGLFIRLFDTKKANLATGWLFAFWSVPALPHLMLALITSAGVSVFMLGGKIRSSTSGKAFDMLLVGDVAELKTIGKAAIKYQDAEYERQ